MRNLKNIVLSIIYLTAILIFFFACVADDQHDIPNDICVENTLVVNASYDEVKALYNGEILRIQEDLIISGYINSSDAASNFFGNIHFQDHPTNPTQGLQIELDLRNLVIFYPIGQKVFIKLKGLYLDNDKGTYKLGGTFTAFGNLSVGRLPATKIKEHIIVSCDEVVPMVPKKYEMGQLDSTMVNTLVVIDELEVASERLCGTFAEFRETTDVELNNCNGAPLIMRNSGFSDFQSALLPLGNGLVTGVLTKEHEEYIITIRDLNDVDMNNERCDAIEYYCEIPEANTTIFDVKEKYLGERVTIKESLVLNATIIANDENKNFSKQLYVQDATGGIKFKLDDTKIFERFPLNAVITIVVNGLTLDKIDEEYTLGILSDEEILGVEKEDYYRFFYDEGEYSEITPNKIEIADISEDDIGSLVVVDSVQFVDNSKFVVNNRDTKSVITDCFANELTLNTSRSFVYGSEVVPINNGSIIGILQYDNEFQIRIRDVADLVGMNLERCNVLDNATEISLETLISQYGESGKEIKENLRIKGFVTTDYLTRNLENTSAIIQNQDIGMELEFKEAHQIPLNSEITIALRGLTFFNDEYGFHIKGLTNDHILNIIEAQPVKPLKVSIDKLLSLKYNNVVVELQGFQFEDVNAVYAGDNVIVNCEDSYTISILESASFANVNVSDGKGNIVGVLIRGRFYVRSVSDFTFDQPYEDCSLKLTSKFVFISEIADPDNSSAALNMRFIELYNSSDKEVSLNGWTLRRYTNANVSFTERSVIDLSGYVIPPESAFIIASNEVDFISTYGFSPNLETGTGSAADSNGDDNIELVDGNGSVVDVFGRPGEDGSGTNHEFEDGRAVRNLTVTTNNNEYDFLQWMVFNDTGESGTANLPKTAPQDYNPGQR